MSAKSFHGIQKIVSGGQTGVDRAALDVAIELGIPHGGWCPKGRLSEDGVIDHRYQLTEHSTSDYAARTLQNVVDSDGTLILYRQRLTGGTLLTNRLAKEKAKPLLRVRMDRAVAYESIVEWLNANQIATLNIAGPRGSSHPELEAEAKSLLRQLFKTTPTLPNLS